MIKPTVGRVVLFHPMIEHDQPYAAIVAYVHSDTLVNLVIFGPEGGVYANNSVLLLPDDAKAPSSGFYAEWMPCQKGQAAKTEEVGSIFIKAFKGKMMDLEAGLHSQAETITAIRDELAHTQTALKALHASIHGPEPGLGVQAGFEVKQTAGEAVPAPGSPAPETAAAPDDTKPAV